MRGNSDQQKHASGSVPVIFFTGGGTGGHVYPGFAVHDALVPMLETAGKNARVVWIGSRRGMEKDIVKEKGIPYIGVPAGKLRRYVSLKNIIDVFKVAAGVVASYFIMVRHRPAAVFSKGGFVSVAPVLGARFARVPAVTHESDYDPGLATRINSRSASKILVSFDDTVSYFPEPFREKVVVTGCPVRPDVPGGDRKKGLDYLQFTEAKPVLFVVGGSQGARFINRLVWDSLQDLLERWNIVHQTGNHTEGPQAGEGYVRLPYIRQEYADILAAADLLVCRAGATTLLESAAAAKPSILIPLGSGSSRGDQIRNAGLFERLGASYILPDGEAQVGDLLELTNRLIEDTALLEKMGSRAATFAKPNAAADIAREIIQAAFGETDS